MPLHGSDALRSQLQANEAGCGAVGAAEETAADSRVTEAQREQSYRLTTAGKLCRDTH